MTPRTHGLAAICAAGLLAAPAAASAASPATVVAGPVKVKDYSMTVTASDAATDSVSVLLHRSAGKATQMHSYTFSQGASVKVAGKLGTAKVRADLGRFGKIDLKLKGAGGAKKGGIPAGCAGKPGKSRSGRLAGSFKLVADSGYFGTISAKSLKAIVMKGGTLKCEGPTGGVPKAPATLTTTQQGPEGMLMFYAAKAADGSVTQTAMRMDDPAAVAPASIVHMIRAPGGASAFAPAADLSSATGTAVAPFFSGAFSYASDMAMGTSSMGTLSGDLVARFDSIGEQAIAAGSPDAMLIKG